MSAELTLTDGMKAVGLDFNPSGNPMVRALKEQYADVIDNLMSARELTEKGDVKRMLSLAITETQSACMWAVKAVTWPY